MSDSGRHPESCGCCSGSQVRTPVRIDNRPGLSAIGYRAGTHATFKDSALARLSGADVPALGRLGARSDDDFSIALLDAWATVADVLSFYQERIANEAFLRTAVERRSVLELARLLGYELGPGVAADAWLAFTLDEPRTPGAPPPLPVTIPPRTKVQSIPGPDETPQTFETVEPIEAHVERNAMRVQTKQRQVFWFGQQELYLEGTTHRLAVGDAILVVRDEPLDDGTSRGWDVRVVRAVEPDDQRGSTRVSWLQGLEHIAASEGLSAHAAVFVFRVRAAVFGHNAPDPNLLSLTGTNLGALMDVPEDGSPRQWKHFGLSGESIDLDQAYPAIVPDSWVLLLERVPQVDEDTPTGEAALYSVKAVDHRSVAAFALSSKVSTLWLDAEVSTAFGRREVLVLAQSERLPLAERPLLPPVLGDRLALARVMAGLKPGQRLAVSGKPQHVRLAASAPALALVLDNGGSVALEPGQRLLLLGPPTKSSASGPLALDEAELDDALRLQQPAGLNWPLEDADGRQGWLLAAPSALVFEAANDEQPTLSEVVAIAEQADAVSEADQRTLLRLALPLSRAYERESVRLNGNVAAATHGETVSEVVGSGDAARRHQRLSLKQRPLTYVGADTASGGESTLDLRVNDVLWQERPALYDAAPNEHVFALRLGDDATVELLFGDGAEGARLPTGQANVRARYRKGLGAAGNVRAGQLTTLLSRPLGVTGVTNPEPASGGENPERLETAREQAPSTVLTLERAVSRQDYEDFARGFAGIDKASASWIASGPRRGIALTVTGSGGSSLAEGGLTHRRLVDALRAHGDRLLPIRVMGYLRVDFELAVAVNVAPEADSELVLEAVREELLRAFSFEARAFGQSVSGDEVMAVVHRHSAIIATDIKLLRRSGDTAVEVSDRLDAARARLSGSNVLPAELLLLDPNLLAVELMS